MNRELSKFKLFFMILQIKLFGRKRKKRNLKSLLMYLNILRFHGYIIPDRAFNLIKKRI